ncbi:MAG: hypothetical protein H0U95_18475 [Bacteroidetes bacterium]|nr:hypothetical protein [Bacteroidota bacterium]
MRLVVLVFMSLLLLSSCKKRKLQTMEVIRGCEGTYLRSNGLDYCICNDDLLDGRESGTFIEVSYIKETHCKTDKVYCGKFHDHQMADGIYKIVRIK